MSFDAQTLFDLLPALYRLRDAQLAQTLPLLSADETARLAALKASPQPLPAAQQAEADRLNAKAACGPLQCLTMLIADQLAAVEADLDQLYDDQFIETCAPWVIPYIGDLIGYRATLPGAGGANLSSRADVAHTISFRRRKGTVLVLEQLARDVTGWGAHAVEFFKVLADTQYMNHVRPDNHYAPDLRRWQPRAYMNSGFDATAHRIDVRRIAIQRGRYNIQNIGIFLWSLNAYSLTRVPATAVAGAAGCFRVSTLARDLPLFTHPVSQGTDITAPAQPVNVPNRLLRHVLCEDIRTIQNGGAALYYGDGASLTNSLALYVIEPGADPSKAALLDAQQLAVCDLSGADGNWTNLPDADSPYRAVLDPHLGRVALRPPKPGQPGGARVQVSCFYGFTGDMGGGEYPRSQSFVGSAQQSIVHVPGPAPGIAIQDALDLLGGDGIVEITDSGIYREAGGLTVNVRAGGHIELRARDGARPTLVLGGELSVNGDADSAFDLNGLVVASSATPALPDPAALLRAPAPGAAAGLTRLGLTHCTLVPGWSLTPAGAPRLSGAPVVIAQNPGLAINIDRAIVGALQVDRSVNVSLTDSIVDACARNSVAYAAPAGPGTGAGGALTMTGCTVIGKIHATLLSLVSDCIVLAAPADNDTWPAPLWADRKQEGCVRFSYVPGGAVIPRHYECIEAAPGVPGPLFDSLRYGDPGYGKLLASTDAALRRGASDGGEMGVFHFVQASARETNLRIRLEEYMPVGLEYGVFYQT
ncbi:hypothetical protein [Paraburkholderia fungorum]|uniref:hypothetical protein n=1 Tax=Paraburkholderia fungorum TaxID=134537 RepID=UPI0038BD2182